MTTATVRGNVITYLGAPGGTELGLEPTQLASKKTGQLLPERVVTGTTDQPTTADAGGFIAFTSASAITLTADDLGQNVTYSVQQQGDGQITVAAGTGVTLVSDKATPSFVSARKGAILACISDGAGNVFVVGNTA